MSAEDPSIAELITARPALRTNALDGVLFEDVPLAGIAAAHGTPTWVYGAATLRSRYRRLMAAFPGVAIHYAVKANDHLAVLSLLAAEGAGADVVSGGELLRALQAGFPAQKIVFSGVGKSAQELRLALDRGVGQINVESAEELELLAHLAAGAEKPARIAFRVNPDVDAGTHTKIATGRRGDKFGIPLDAIPDLFARAAAAQNVAAVGLAVHIGSQIFASAPFGNAYGKLAAMVRTLRQAGHRVDTVDCGGGLGVPYQNQPAALPEAWAGAISAAFAGLDLALAIEPGRWIAAPAGILLTRVIRTRRHGVPRPIVMLDAAMNDLLRPAMYEAWHGIIPVGANALHRPPETVDIAGPVCESSDFFARQRALPALEDGALVAILDAGAYGAVMSSTYNARPLAAQVMVAGGQATLIRPRPALEDLWSDEVVPLFCRPA